MFLRVPDQVKITNYRIKENIDVIREFFAYYELLNFIEVCLNIRQLRDRNLLIIQLLCDCKINCVIIIVYIEYGSNSVQIIIILFQDTNFLFSLEYVCTSTVIL